MADTHSEGATMRRIAIGIAAVAVLSGCADATDAKPDVAGQSSAQATGAAQATTSATPKPGNSTPPAKSSAPKRGPRSDVSQLERAGIGLGEGVLIDVADDGEDRYLQIGAGGAVGFTGTTRTDSTMMSLKPAATARKNRVVIEPPFWNEDLGAGHCVAGAKGSTLKLEVCEPGKASQTWRVALAGDSGLFELHGAYGVVKIDGRTGLQTIPFAR